MKRVRL